MKAFLTGLGIGVGLGVVFAPTSGEATRRKVRERFTGLADDLGRRVDKQKTWSRKQWPSSKQQQRF